MNLEQYSLQAERTLMVFQFVSEGPKGAITKLVQYSRTNLKDFYNLGFGDTDALTGAIDDTVITNNGDSQKVLATVAATVYVFTDKYPNVWIYATGNNKTRTRLYRMGISNNLTAITAHFYIYGLLKGEWRPFEKGTEYEAFLIRRK